MIDIAIEESQLAHYWFHISTGEWPGTRPLDWFHPQVGRRRQCRFAEPICSGFRAESLLLLGHQETPMVFRLM
jgi:hypothetical protein